VDDLVADRDTKEREGLRVESEIGEEAEGVLGLRSASCCQHAEHKRELSLTLSSCPLNCEVLVI